MNEYTFLEYILQCIRNIRVYAYTRYFSSVYLHTGKIQCIRVSHSILVVNKIYPCLRWCIPAVASLIFILLFSVIINSSYYSDVVSSTSNIIVIT